MSTYVDAINESLADAMMPDEMEPALEILRDTLGAKDAGYFRFPRVATGAAAEFVIKNPSSIKEGKEKRAVQVDESVIVMMLDDIKPGERGSAGIVVDGATKLSAVDACAAAFAAAHRRAVRFQALSGQMSGLQTLIEHRLGACAALASSRGDVLWMSESARDVLGADGKDMLETRLRAAMKDAGDSKQFVINVEGKNRLFGEMSFVRENPQTSVHYIAIELHGTGVDATAVEAKLTRCERDVYKLLRQGMSNEEIAKARFVSIETVRSHVKGIFRKTGVSSRVELLVRKDEQQA